MIKVESQVPIYEIDGNDIPLGDVSDRPHILVSSHWNKSDLVLLKWAEGKSATVRVADLEAAIKNASNTSRF